MAVCTAATVSARQDLLCIRKGHAAETSFQGPTTGWLILANRVQKSVHMSESHPVAVIRALGSVM